ncbi:hypothetical protein D3C79_727630 [compost metagenome]
MFTCPRAYSPRLACCEDAPGAALIPAPAVISRLLRRSLLVAASISTPPSRAVTAIWFADALTPCSFSASSWPAALLSSSCSLANQLAPLAVELLSSTRPVLK